MGKDGLQGHCCFTSMMPCADGAAASAAVAGGSFALRLTTSQRRASAFNLSSRSTFARVLGLAMKFICQTCACKRDSRA